MESKKRNTKKSGTSKTKRTTKKSSGTSRARKSKRVKLDHTKVLWFVIGILIAAIILLSVKFLLPKTADSEVEKPKTPVEKPQADNSKKDKDKNSSQMPEEVFTEEDKLSRDLEKFSLEAQKEKDALDRQEAAEKAQKEKEKKADEKKALEEQKRKAAEAKAIEEQKKKEAELNALEEKKKQEQSQHSTSFNFPQAVNKAQIVFLLDDGGQNLSQLEKFTSLQMPLTIAVLPKLAHSKECAQKIRSAGKEVMLHQPMQSVNDAVNPGPGAIKPDMSDSEIRAILAQNFDEVGPIAGFNNHEGSAITADAHKMEVIMKYASDNGVFFLDSRTNKDTQVPYVCNALGYSYYERNGLFLDNKLTQAEKDQGLTMRTKAIELIRKNVDKANKEGVVIMIGHVWSADWLSQVLKDVYPELKAKDYVITTVSNCKGKK
nr:divergent polysaccharide deacetylase family protein [uncultured Treponema sp.]